MRAFAAVSVVLLAALVPACTRGCGGCSTGDGDPVPACATDRDCTAPTVCRRAYCRTPAFTAKDDFCRAHPSCKEAGHCGAEVVRSFLGASSTLECVAVDVADCKASTNCAVHGRCSLETANERDRCIADQVADCAASTSCKTLDECTPDGGNCVRDLTGCTPAGDDDFALGDGFAADLAALGDLAPGALDDAILACVTTAADARAFVRIGSACTVAPVRRGRAFARHVHLAIGDRILVAIQGRELANPHDPVLAMTYAGRSPLVGEEPRPAIACHVLARADATRLGMRVLAELDRALAAAKAHRLPATELVERPDPVPGLRARLAHAAGWLGAGDPDLADRAREVDDLAAARRGVLEAKIAAAATGAARTGTPVEIQDGVRVAVRDLVCGDALRARYAAIGDARTVDAAACGVELAVDNRGDAPISIGWLGFAMVRSAWLRPHARAGVDAYEPATVIDARLDTPTAPAAAKDLVVGPGARAIVLVGDERADLELGPGRADADALLRFETWRGPTRALRVDPP